MSLIHLEILDKNRQKLFSQLKIFAHRAVWRDYVDLFWVLKHKSCLKTLIGWADKKFSEEFEAKRFLEQLTYFEDIQKTKISWIDKGFTSKHIKVFLEKIVTDYLNNFSGV